MGGFYPSFGAPNPPTPDKWWYKYADWAAYALIAAIGAVPGVALAMLLEWLLRR